MISIICIFNNYKKLSECLLSSLEHQSVSYDLVLVDNTESEFASAASALNHGASKAKGEFLMFVHQDVMLYSESWIEEVEEYLINLKRFGWVGVAGVTERGELQGFIKDSNSLLWTQFGQIVEVQTLDEVILICEPKKDGDYFDEKNPGWHAYGAQACITSQLNGRKNYVISFPVWHKSNRSNNQGLELSHEYLREKFRGKLASIQTTCGVIDTNTQVAALHPRFKHLSEKLLRLLRIKSRARWYWDVMNDFTNDCETIICYYDYFPHDSITAESFTQFPVDNIKRTIKHCFTGDKLEETLSDCVVFESNIAEKIAQKKCLLNSLLISGQVLVCTEDTNHQKVLKMLNQTYRIETFKTVKSATSGYGKSTYVSRLSAF